MAQRHRGVRFEGHNSPNFRGAAAAVAPFGLIPPRICIATNINAAGLTGIRHALPELRFRMGCRQQGKCQCNDAKNGRAFPQVHSPYLTVRGVARQWLRGNSQRTERTAERAAGGVKRLRYTQTMVFLVESVLCGTVQMFADGETSAIAKTPTHGQRAIAWLGIAGDAQADLSVHGGPDKAIHHYSSDHYPYWRTALGNVAVLSAPGAFGENISTAGLTEDIACIGDRYRLGTALVEIAQGRQPCWKQAHRLNHKTVVTMMVRTRRCGWYYRVIEEGSVQAGEVLTLVDRPLPEWTVAHVIGLLIAGEGRRDPAAVRALAALPVLAENWRRRAAALAQP
jgi:MOSC domain-containing protein YiiM